ncbi:MAG: multifunctional oxoglutarate decarboxylase/oxoglutarate dehydrogenase thiamine pyrophosphate-binding subunit/dihydrolipoyllysine-residue succinyltransferase subunit [Actinomycetes bacterium]
MAPQGSSSSEGGAGTSARGSFGPNAWLVDDMYRRFLADPTSVAQSWREFFADYRPQSTVAAVAPAKPTVAATPPASVVSSATPLRGASARIVANMVASLSVPTATSVRTVPARLLEVNRSALNDQLMRTSAMKVSFTHLIGFAVVRALSDIPALNAAFVEAVDDKGTPGIMRPDHVGLGLAVDVEKSDGTRNLMVPCIKDAGSMDFRSFLLAYEDLVRKVHTGSVTPEDFAGSTISLTNPGTLGTVQSVPRLMPGQGAIIGVGSIGWPAGFEAADPRMLADLGLGKVLTITSTYDHRIIQGAESGLFLKNVAERLTGGHGFYEEVFAALGIPYEPSQWRRDRNPVDSDDAGEFEQIAKQLKVHSLINMYRVRGHLDADLDPLSAEPPHLHPELDPLTYGLTIWDLPRTFLTDGLLDRPTATLDEMLSVLRDAYCRTLGIEYMHIQDPEQKAWIQHHVEGVATTIGVEEQRHILDRLNAAEVFERFLHTRYVGQKRFGLEGAESTVVALDALIDAAAVAGSKEVYLGTAHRGRLNLLANIVGKSYGEIFSEFEGNLDPESVQGSGDVKYHKGASGVLVGLSGLSIPVTMASNPSHLEAVNPVVEGMARAKQDQLAPPTDGTPEAFRTRADDFPVLAILVHGDAAFAGQGIVAETLNLSELSGYRTGGSVHLVINNQVGFTTSPSAARSSYYSTDVAKMVQAPIFHVNGDDPEACVRAARLAFAFRERFHKDVVIDLVCYRRHGHNEGDDPSYTQPLMYRTIEEMRSVRKLYTETLIRRGDLTLEEAEQGLDAFGARLQAVLDEVREREMPVLSAPPVHEIPVDPPAPTTGVAVEILERIAEATASVPEGFTLHPKLARQFEQRRAMVASGWVDWSLAEALAMGSLLVEGTNVRLTGEDTRRGTFSQRHAVLVDYADGEEWVPLANLETDPARFTIRDTLLSEYAVLGFEYGYSVESPESLTMWEAQFGDFVNGAEIIIDNFLVAAEDKWGQVASLVMLLPHGYEGQGPEHSSARIERFLTLCARNNLRVVVPSTAAQYFHLIRSQVRRERLTPLVVMTPKSMLRAEASRSSLDDLVSGSFLPVLDDLDADPAAVRRIIMASGKVAHEAIARQAELSAEGSPAAASTAIVRVEQLYPWPDAQIDEVIGRYTGATELVWLQEEPKNMGAWPFVHHQFHRELRDRMTLRHVARAESASPATGSGLVHRAEQEDLLVRAFAGL